MHAAGLVGWGAAWFEFCAPSTLTASLFFTKNERVNGKNEAVVKCDFKMLAKVEATSFEDQKYFWDKEAVDEFKIDKVAVLELVKSKATQGTSTAEWSL